MTLKLMNTYIYIYMSFFTSFCIVINGEDLGSKNTKCNHVLSMLSISDHAVVHNEEIRYEAK